MTTMHCRPGGRLLALALFALAAPAMLAAQSRDSIPAASPTPDCPPCAEWNAPHAPVRLFANTWFVGTDGLGAVLVTSPAGHVLIDAGLPESAPRILENIRAAGFRWQDVKLILNSHAHYDHAGGIALLQRVTGAAVAAHPWSARTIMAGRPLPDDPSLKSARAYPAARGVRTIAEGDTLRVGALALVAHFTGGHTPGGTSWSWRACEGGRCLDFVYADSQTPISDDDFLFTRSTTYRTGVADFEKGHATLERLSCDVIVTPHPGASDLWERVAAREQGLASALGDGEGCRRYVANARRALQQRLARERAAPK
jgi:metallo-beta-lactamase class B